MSGLGGGNGVEHHRRRVGSLMLPDDIHPGPSGPDLQLIRCRRTEGIRRAQQHLFPVVLHLMGQLADGGGFAHTVDADHQNDAGLGGKLQLGVAHIQHLHQNVLQGLPHLVGTFEMLHIHLFPELLHGLHRRVHAQIRQNQALLQVVIKIVVNAMEARKNPAQGILEALPGFGQSGLDFFKKAHVPLSFLLRDI